MPNFLHPMGKALALAKEAAHKEEVPVGAVVVERASGTIVASAFNQVEMQHDPTAHAELVALRDACHKYGKVRIPECDLYVTLEPCPMCAMAISFARIRRLYFGAYDPKGGGVEHGPKIFHSSSCHHIPEIYGGIYEAEAAMLLQSFFKKKR